MYFVTEPCFVAYIMFLVVSILTYCADSKSDDCQIVSFKHLLLGKIQNGRHTKVVEKTIFPQKCFFSYSGFQGTTQYLTLT